ncbi:MAG: sugar kinase [Bacteroidota bacterium]
MTRNKVITFGEIMLRLSTPGHSRFSQAECFNATYGGGEANVAVSLAHFGVPAGHVTRFPDHEVGHAAALLLRKYGVDTSHIVYGGPRIGIYFLETGASVRPSKVVYDRAGSSFEHIQPGMLNWEQIFADASHFHWTGITPAISQGAADTCLEAIKTANRMGITVSGDLNYRKNLWQYGKKASEVMPELAAGCDLLFASRSDMEEILGGPVQDTEADRFVNTCKEMTRRCPRAQKIVNTRRSSVSASHNTLHAMLWDGEKLIKTGIQEINPIIDRIGGGDAFVAGYLYALRHYHTDKDVLEFALAASVLKHSIPGDANLVTAAEVEPIMRGETGGKLSR